MSNTATVELTTQAEHLFYRLRNKKDNIWQARRMVRPGLERERLDRQWRRAEHASERAYARMMRRRRVTGWTYMESC